jgi:hypothetical protein
LLHVLRISSIRTKMAIIFMDNAAFGWVQLNYNHKYLGNRGIKSGTME